MVSSGSSVKCMLTTRYSKQLWVRPTVEGHMGYLWKDGKKTENGISGGRQVKHGLLIYGKPVVQQRG